MATQRKAVPYIGITGFTAPGQTVDLLDRFPLPTAPNHHFMIGVLASAKTLAGETPGNEDRYPRIERVGRVFRNHFRALNFVHYTSRRDHPLPLHEQLIRLERYGRWNLNGIQLNIPWPSLHEVRLWRELSPEMLLVLQVGPRAMAQLDNDPQRIAQHVRLYEPAIDYVLLDQSDGAGTAFDSSYIVAVIEALQEAGVTSELIVAGGLGPGKLAHLEPVAEFCREVGRTLSVDVESGVRTRGDLFDPNRGRDFVVQVSRVL